MPPSDPGFPALALEVRRAAEWVVRLARDEEVAAREISEQRGSTTLQPIDRISPAKELAGILEEWRAVEHRLGGRPPVRPRRPTCSADSTSCASATLARSRSVRSVKGRLTETPKAGWS